MRGRGCDWIPADALRARGMMRGRRGEGSDPLPPSPIRVAAAIVGRCRCPVTVRRDRRIGAVDDRRRVVHDDRRRVIDNGWRVVGGCSVIRACSVVRTRGGVNVAKTDRDNRCDSRDSDAACSSRRASPRSAHRMLWGPVPLVRRQPGSERSPQPTAQHPRGSRQATIYAYAPPIICWRSKYQRAASIAMPKARFAPHVAGKRYLKRKAQLTSCICYDFVWFLRLPKIPKRPDRTQTLTQKPAHLFSIRRAGCGLRSVALAVIKRCYTSALETARNPQRGVGSRALPEVLVNRMQSCRHVIVHDRLTIVAMEALETVSRTGLRPLNSTLKTPSPSALFGRRSCWSECAPGKVSFERSAPGVQWFAIRMRWPILMAAVVRCSSLASHRPRRLISEEK